MSFKDVKLHQVFYFNGTYWRKQSTRTAAVAGQGRRHEAIFYFSQNDHVQLIQ